MTKDIRNFSCKGRDSSGHEVLAEAVSAEVLIQVSGDREGSILIFVRRCEHVNVPQSAGQQCNASKVEGIPCAYSFNSAAV